MQCLAGAYFFFGNAQLTLNKLLQQKKSILHLTSSSQFKASFLSYTAPNYPSCQKVYLYQALIYLIVGVLRYSMQHLSSSQMRRFSATEKAQTFAKLQFLQLLQTLIGKQQHRINYNLKSKMHLVKVLVILLVAIQLINLAEVKQLLTKDGNCYKIKCLTNKQMPIKCSQKSDFNLEIHLNSNICKSNQRCSINKKYSGSCKKKVYFEKIKPLFPGQECDLDWHFYQCGFAYKTCSEGVCLGIPTGGQCSVSADCQTTDYCFAGVCHAKKSLGDSCMTKYECGREAFCYFNVATNSGVCKAHYSITSSDTTTFVLPKINNKILADYADPDANLLCESGYADPTSGLCSSGPKSLKMGQSCTANSDCTSSVSGVTAECKCTWGSLGVRVCSALAGDTPYVQARAAFKEYYNITKGCHQAARWEQCGESKAYHNWKCKELKAIYYAETLFMDDVKSCMDKLNEDLVIFNDIDYHCQKAGN